MGEVKRNRNHRGHQQPGVLAKRRERTRVQRVVQRFQPPLQRLPLLDRQLRIRRLLAQQIAEPTRGVIVPGLKPPVPLRRPHRNPVVRLHRHRLPERVQHHPQRVPRRSIQPLPNARSDLKLIQRPVRRSMIEHVTAPAREIMTLKHLHPVSVLRQQRGARQPTDPASDHHDVVRFARVVQRARARHRSSPARVFPRRARYPRGRALHLARARRRARRRARGAARHRRVGRHRARRHRSKRLASDARAARAL